ncbi:MAG: iron ABC transporter permease [Bacteroidota bacterium]|nr:iron ABC transporter permease [Bacteroidota bacterium]
MFKFHIFLLILLLIALLGVDVFLIPNVVDFSFKNLEDLFILNQFRLPKAITALLTGSSLALSGFILQQLFKNQLAGPYILGVSSGASLFVALFIILGASFPIFQSLNVSVAGFLGAILVLIFISLLSFKYGNGYLILLFGVIIGMITGSLQTLLVAMASVGELKSFTMWSMGSFSQVIDVDLIVLSFSAIAGIVWAFLLMPQLSILILGNEIATSMGINPKRVSFSLLVCTGLLTGVTTAFCGPIAFIGIAIPNLVKLLFKTVNFRLMLFANCILGAIMALLGDIVASLSVWGFQVPINVTTTLIGGPFVIYILFKKRK